MENEEKVSCACLIENESMIDFAAADAELKKTYPDLMRVLEEDIAAKQAASFLKEIRNHAGLSQKELAKITGIESSNISRMEAGKTSRGISLPLLSQLAKACGARLQISCIFDSSNSNATSSSP